MATIFVSAVDGSNADDGSTWALAKQTVAGALAIATSGDVIYVDNAGTFTATAAIIWTASVAVSIKSATRSGTVTAVPAVGAIEQCGAASAGFTITGTVGAYIYGMVIKAGTNTNAACKITINNNVECVSCTFDLPTASGNNINVATVGYTRFLGCTFNRTGSSTATYFVFNDIKCEIINPTFNFTGASKPSTLFSWSLTNNPTTVIMRDGDISGFSGSSIAVVTGFAGGTLLLQNLKLNATPTITSGTFSANGWGDITIRNCDSADTIYDFEYRNAYGTLTVSTSQYVNSGFTFGSGAINCSWKIVTTAACGQITPFRLPPISIWNTTTSAQTAAIEFAQDSAATALTDQDIWSDLDYAASASFPNYSWQNNRNAQPITGTPANQTSSSATWTGLTTPTTQKLNNAFTAAEIGLLQSVVSIGKASTTVYINPKIDGVT